MYGAPDGLKRALDDFVSAARQQNLRLSVLLLEDQQQRDVPVGGQVELQTEVSEGRIPDFSQGETSHSERLTSTAPVAGPSTPRDSSVAQLGPSQGSTSRHGSGLGKRSFTEQSPSFASLGGRPQSRDPVVLVVNKHESDRLREYIVSTVDPVSAFPGTSQSLGLRPGLSVPPQEASAGARPVKRLSLHSLGEGLSAKRTRIGQEEEMEPRLRPMSMPAIRTPLQSDPSGQLFQPPSMAPKFWGTVLAPGQSGNPSEQFPERHAEATGSTNPADSERFLPMLQGKRQQSLNPDQPGDELKAGGQLPGTLVGQMRSRSVSMAPEPLGYPRQPTPLRSPSMRGSSPSLRAGSPSFRLDPKGAEPSYRDVGAGDIRRDPVGSRDPSQPPSIFDSRAQFPRPTRMELSPAQSPFPTRGKSLSALPPLGRDFSVPTSHRPGPGGSPVEGMARQADLTTGPHQPSLPSLARALSAHPPQQLPLTRSIHESDSVTMGAGDTRAGGMLSRVSAPSGAIGGFGGRREGIRLPMQQPDTLHGPVEYVSTAGRTGNVISRAMSSGQQAFSCPQCEATFRRRSDMNRHVRVVHEKQRPFQCPTCSNRFGEKSNMIKHIRMVHENIRGFRCHHCDAAFGQRGNCEAHVRAVHEKRPGKYSCDHCNRAFSRKAQLVEHHSQEHPDLPMPQARTRSRAGPSGVVATPPQTAPGSQQRIPVLRNPSASPVAAQVYETAARSLLHSQSRFRQQLQMQRQQHVQMQQQNLPQNLPQNPPSQWIPPPQQQQQLQPGAGRGIVQDEQARTQTQPGRPGSETYGMHPKQG